MYATDFRQAFDSVHRNKLFTAREFYGIPQKIMMLINMKLNENMSKVLRAIIVVDPLIHQPE